MSTSDYIKRYISQARKEHKRSKETWLKGFFKKLSEELEERSSNASQGDKYIITGAFSAAFNELIPSNLKLAKEPKIIEYIDLPKDDPELSKLLGSKRIDFAIDGKNSTLLIEFKTNIQFNDISAAMIEMLAVKQFSKKCGKAISTASLHLFPYRTNVDGLRSLNVAIGDPLDNIWILCTPELAFDIEAMYKFRKDVSNIVDEHAAQPGRSKCCAFRPPVSSTLGVMSMAINPRVVSRCLLDVEALIASSRFTQYLVGYTSDLETRRCSYRGAGIPHIYALATGLNSDQAIELERALFEACVRDKESTLYAKYHMEKRDKPYSPSKGGKAPSSSSCSVYAACFGE